MNASSPLLVHTFPFTYLSFSTSNFRLFLLAIPDTEPEALLSTLKKVLAFLPHANKVVLKV